MDAFLEEFTFFQPALKMLSMLYQMDYYRKFYFGLKPIEN